MGKAMVDSRVKGRTAELNARNELRSLTGLKWERTPGSGALGAQHMLKGDLYVPNAKNHWCIEVKHYADDHINSGLLTHKTPQFVDWWRQAVTQAWKVEMIPLLIFKYNRSKWFTAYMEEDNTDWPMHWTKDRYLEYNYWDEELDEHMRIVITTLTDFCYHPWIWID